MPQKQLVSDLMLEQFSLGELDSRQEKAVREALAEDEILRERLEALRDSDKQILSDYPAEQVVPSIQERARESRQAPRRSWGRPFVMALSTVAVALVVVSFFMAPPTRLKGLSPHLSVFRKTPSGAEELRPGSVAKRGDVLQLSYTAGDAKYGVIISVDGRGSITWHSPAGYAGGQRTAPALDAHGPVVLSSAYELDDAPSFERFFLVYASAPFQVSDVDRAARTLAARGAAAANGTLTLPGGLGQYSLLVKK
jgi:hypothetical protein